MDCSLCYHTCPGGEVDFDALNNEIFGRKPGFVLGNFEKIYVGSAAKEYPSAASGSVVSGLLLSLLKDGIVDAAAIVDFAAKEPDKAVFKIAQTADEIINAAGSKYVLTPADTALRIMDGEKKYAAVTLPCQSHGIRKAVQSGVLKNINFIIGLYCGNNLYHAATRSILKRFAMDQRVRKIAYRSGAWPGFFSAEDISGRTKKMTKSAFNYLSFLYTPDRCFYCIDLTNELADISVGDAWGYQSKSVIVVRTKKALSLIEKMRSAGQLLLEEISPEEAMMMHAHGLDNKKAGAFARMSIGKSRGLPVPAYGTFKAEAGAGRFRRERIFMKIVRIGRSGFVRFLAGICPVWIWDMLMSAVRKKWRKTTQKKTRESIAK